MFAYCNSNPVKFSDSTGNIIEISTDASDEEKELYLKAVEYLQASETARALLEKVEAADVVFTIVIVYGNDKATVFDYQDHTIYYNPYLGFALGDRVSVQSTALQLAHELGHVSQYIDGALSDYIAGDEWMKKSLQSAIEADNMERYETPIAQQLGEPVRHNYNEITRLVTMSNPTHFITKQLYPNGRWSWFYFLLGGKSRMEIIQHNY